MRTARSYKNRQGRTDDERDLLEGVICSLTTGSGAFVILLLLVSLAEWLMPAPKHGSLPYIADAIPLFSIGIGTYLGSRHLGRSAAWLGLICGLIAWMIGLGMAWCLGITITLNWLVISAGISLITAFIGAMTGLLHVR